MCSVAELVWLLKSGLCNVLVKTMIVAMRDVTMRQPTLSTCAPDEEAATLCERPQHHSCPRPIRQLWPAAFHAVRSYAVKTENPMDGPTESALE